MVVRHRKDLGARRHERVDIAGRRSSFRRQTPLGWNASSWMFLKAVSVLKSERWPFPISSVYRLLRAARLRGCAAWHGAGENWSGRVT
jgi:hypothetical protein